MTYLSAFLSLYIKLSVLSRCQPGQKHLQDSLFQHSLSAQAIPHLPILSPTQVYRWFPLDTHLLNPALTYSLLNVVLIHSHHMSWPSHSTTRHTVIIGAIDIVWTKPLSHPSHFWHFSIGFSCRICTPRPLILPHLFTISFLSSSTHPIFNYFLRLPRL